MQAGRASSCVDARRGNRKRICFIIHPSRMRDKISALEWQRLFRLFVIRLLPPLWEDWEEKGGGCELLFVNMDDFSGSIVE
jgi:hypothetical protein